MALKPAINAKATPRPISARPRIKAARLSASADAREIGDAMRIDANLALLEPVAHEQILHDGHHFLAAPAIETAPPALEIQEPLPLAIDMREERCVLFPQRVAWLQSLEALCQPGTVELPLPKIGEKMREPHPPDQTGRDPHGVYAWLAGPMERGEPFKMTGPASPRSVRKRASLPTPPGSCRKKLAGGRDAVSPRARRTSAVPRVRQRAFDAGKARHTKITK